MMTLISQGTHMVTSHDDIVPTSHDQHDSVNPSKVDKLKGVIALESLNCTLYGEIRGKGVRGRSKRSHLNLGKAT